MATELRAVIGRRVLTPAGFKNDHAVILRGARIKSVVPAAKRDASAAIVAEADIVAPGFIDIQINGAADRLFNDDPSVATIAAIAGGARKGGTAHLLPTFITSSDEARLAAVAAIREAMKAGTPGVLGLHLEGPFLNPARRGAHQARFMRGMAMKDVEALPAPGKGVMLMTLAPEEAKEGVVRALTERRVIVFAGHSNGRLRDYRKAHGEGLRGFTHLFNAMSQIAAREPGAVGAAFALDESYAGVIADGRHVAPENLAMLAKLKRRDRIILVTDAMPTVGGKKDHFLLDERRIALRDGMLVDEAGVLAGAHLAMDEAVAGMTKHAGVPLDAALRMASENPAQAIGLGDQLGKIARGYRASLTLMDDDLKARGVVIDGRLL